MRKGTLKNIAEEVNKEFGYKEGERGSYGISEENTGLIFEKWSVVRHSGFGSILEISESYKNEKECAEKLYEYADIERNERFKNPNRPLYNGGKRVEIKDAIWEGATLRKAVKENKDAFAGFDNKKVIDVNMIEDGKLYVTLSYPGKNAACVELDIGKIKGNKNLMLYISGDLAGVFGKILKDEKHSMVKSAVGKGGTKVHWEVVAGAVECGAMKNIIKNWERGKDSIKEVLCTGRVRSAVSLDKQLGQFVDVKKTVLDKEAELSKYVFYKGDNKPSYVLERKCKKPEAGGYEQWKLTGDINAQSAKEFIKQWDNRMLEKIKVNNKSKTNKVVQK